MQVVKRATFQKALYTPSWFKPFKSPTLLRIPCMNFKSRYAFNHHICVDVHMEHTYIYKSITKTPCSPFPPYFLPLSDWSIFIIQKFFARNRTKPTHYKTLCWMGDDGWMEGGEPTMCLSVFYGWTIFFFLWCSLFI